MKRILMRGFFCGRTAVSLLVLGGAFAGGLVRPVWSRTPQTASPAVENPQTSETRVGGLSTREGLRLQLVADLGNVRILTQDPGKDAQVTYKVQLDTDSRGLEAKELLKQFVFTARVRPDGVQLIGRAVRRSLGLATERIAHLWVNIEVTVPRRYNLDVLTRAGNIETQDVEGRASLVTSGGNISAGSVGGPEAAGALLETQGGHVTVQRVNGELRASTAGGHINVRNVQGDATLHTGGGHIRAGTIRGTAALETAGGNISLQRATSNVAASTGGGQIDVGEAGGAVRARTVGGGIRIQRVSGLTELQTGGGSIVLAQVQSAVRASTGAGTITAWFTSEGKLAGASELESGQGDIVVYLPKELPITIDALIEAAGEHHIEADPSLPLQVSYVHTESGARAVRGKGTLNGGGEVLRLKTTAGNIQLKLADADPEIRLRLERQMEQLKGRLEAQQQRLAEQIWQSESQIRRQVIEEHKRQASRLEEWARKFEQLWRGAIRIDSETQQQKLIHSVRPVYPDVAREAGIEGRVRLRATIGKDGTVQDVEVLSGRPLLAEAARVAVRQWRYQPTLLDGKPVNVVTNVTVVFRLH